MGTPPDERSPFTVYPQNEYDVCFVGVCGLFLSVVHECSLHTVECTLCPAENAVCTGTVCSLRSKDGYCAAVSCISRTVERTLQNRRMQLAQQKIAFAADIFGFAVHSLKNVFRFAPHSCEEECFCVKRSVELVVVTTHVGAAPRGPGAAHREAPAQRHGVRGV